jgi:hypothetical protein
MAVRLGVWSGSKDRVGVIAEPAAPSRILSLEERKARIQRRRRMSRAHAALEGAIWLAGSGVIAFLALAGMFGLK